MLNIRKITGYLNETQVNINVDETVPKVVWFTSAPTHDHILLCKLELSPHFIYIFHKGYNDYKTYNLFTEKQTGFVTHLSSV